MQFRHFVKQNNIPNLYLLRMGVVPPCKKHRDDLPSCPGSLLALLSPVAAISLACDPNFFRKRSFWAHAHLPVCLLCVIVGDFNPI